MLYGCGGGGAGDSSSTTSSSSPTSSSQLDTSFNGTGIVTTPVGTSDDNAWSVAVQPDGKIVVAGYTWNGADYDFAVVRYDATGSLDATFGSGGRVITLLGTSDDRATGVAVQSDGKSVVAGSSHNGANHDFAVVRYTATGSLDATFGSGGKVTTPLGTGDDLASGVAVQSDDKIVVAGSSYNGTDYDFALVRYDAATGSLDTTFGAGGKVTTAIGPSHDVAGGVAVQPDGRIVATGYASDGTYYYFATARYTTTGSLDTTFGAGGIAITAVGPDNDFAQSAAIQPDGKVVVAGYSSDGTYYYFAVVRYTSAGSLDTTFGAGGGVVTAVGMYDDYAYGVAIQPDGKIVVAGYSSNGANDDFAVARYNP